MPFGEFEPSQSWHTSPGTWLAQGTWWGGPRADPGCWCSRPWCSPHPSSPRPRDLMRMCLLRSWKTGFFAKAKADLLSTLSSTACASLPRRSPSSWASHKACVEEVVAAMYSASQLDRATTCCLIDCQLTRHLPKKKSVPVVLLLLSMSPARSLSLYPMKCSAPGDLG